jgi:hypothetical protein
MALNDATLNSLGTTLAGLITHAELHSGDPGAAGTANQTTAARQAVTFNVDADGDLTLTGTVSFTGGAASGGCTHVSLWGGSGAATKGTGTIRGSYALTGDQTFNAAGEYNLTGLTINGTAS